MNQNLPAVALDADECCPERHGYYRRNWWYRQRYHEVVSNAAKILDQMRNNPRDWRIEDLKTIAKRHGVDWDHDCTSHVIFRHPVAGRLPVPAHRPVKPPYIRSFLTYIDKLEEAK